MHGFRILFLAALCLNLFSAEERFKNPAYSDPSFFPIAVWLQNPSNAPRFKAAGINTYVGLWRGPTEEQFSALKVAGMKIVCAQNAVALAHKDDTNIIAWMQDDEPDNAQSLGAGKGYGPPILPEKVVARYHEMREKDSTRPILLNLGQGVAWDNYIGRGVRRNHPEDYAAYVKGGDIVSFDIYPATHDDEPIRGKLEYVGNGVKRLKEWGGAERLVWNCVEAKVGDNGSHISPKQLRAEVWMSLIHGSRGIIYFVHQFKPQFREASLFDDVDLLKAVTEVDREIKEFAPILNSPTVDGVLSVAPKKVNEPVAAMMKKHHGEIYIFAVGMSAQKTAATFKVEGLSGNEMIEALGEGRELENPRAFADEFDGYQPHLYRISKRR